MSSGVNYGSNHDDSLLFYDLVNDTIGKALGKAPANVLGWMTAAVLKRINRQFVEHGDNLFDEFIAETLPLPVIPIGRFKNVVPRLGSRNDCPFHLFYLECNRVFNSSRDIEEAGSA